MSAANRLGVDRSKSDDTATGSHRDEDINVLNDTNAGAPAVGDAQELKTQNPTVHLSRPREPDFSTEVGVSKAAWEDRQLFFSDCIRIQTSRADFREEGETKGELRVNRGGVYVESKEEGEVRLGLETQIGGAPPSTIGVGISINIDGGKGERLDINNTDTEMEDQSSRRPYLVLGLLATSTSIPKETMVRIQSRSRLFKELRQAASKLRPWPIRMLSLKSESGFGIYECTEHGIHRHVQVDQSSQHTLAEMFRAYQTGRRDFDSTWLNFVHIELNHMNSNPRYGKYSLQLVLRWSAPKLVVWGSIPIVLSFVIGFWYMFLSHPGEDHVAVVQTAWGLSSYIVTAGALAIAILAAVTQIGNS